MFPRLLHRIAYAYLIRVALTLVCLVFLLTASDTPIKSQGGFNHITVDDAWIYDGKPLYIARNDVNPMPQATIVDPPDFGTLVNSGQFQNYGPGITGVYVDSYSYKWCEHVAPFRCSNTATVTLLIINDGSQDFGNYCAMPPPKPAPPSPNKGQPVNVTNGNMWLQHSDYSLPGLGEAIEINRFYNSKLEAGGLFGYGWTTKYDEYLTLFPGQDRMLDGMSRLKRLLHQSTTSTLVDNNFTYNPANRISQIAELAQTRSLTYDNVDRLTGMTNGTANESYTFDGVGNRTASHLSTTYTYQPYNRMTATATATMGYNANGNLVQKTEASTTWQYTWDYENRMKAAVLGSVSAEYRYDALDRRVERTAAATQENTKFVYDGLDVVMDDDATTGITKYQNGLGVDDKLKLTNGAVAKYFLADHLGSTVAMTDASEAVTEQTSYDSFGNPATNLSTRYQYTGREYDSFSGLYYYRARWYDAHLGRFISEDPIGFGGGDMNLYGYVRNQPLWYRDPRGLQPGADVMAQPSTWQAIAAAAAAAAGAAASSPAVVGAGGLAVGAAIGYPVGTYTASHPSNPFVNGPWPLNPYKPPFGYPAPVYPTPTISRPYCQPAPRAIPFDLVPAMPRTRSQPERDGCDKQYADDQQVCFRIADSQMRGACFAHAFDRWASCKAGRNIPYNPWPQFPWD